MVCRERFARQNNKIFFIEIRNNGLGLLEMIVVKMQCCAIEVEQKTHFLLTSSAHFMMIIVGIDDIFLSFLASKQIDP